MSFCEQSICLALILSIAPWAETMSTTAGCSYNCLPIYNINYDNFFLVPHAECFQLRDMWEVSCIYIPYQITWQHPSGIMFQALIWLNPCLFYFPSHCLVDLLKYLGLLTYCTTTLSWALLFWWHLLVKWKIHSAFSMMVSCLSPGTGKQPKL